MLAVEEQLEEYLSATKMAFDNLLSEVDHTFKVGDLEVEARFYYIKFDANGRPRYNDFFEVIWRQILAFCIPPKEIVEAKRLFEEENDPSLFVAINDKAKRLFLEAKNTGEPGELILFLFLENKIKAPQIVCKMYLKTNNHMPVHGTDGIHMKYDKDTDTLYLYWGESKIYEKLSTALDECLNSIHEINTEDGTGRRALDRDVQLITDHMKIYDEDLKKVIKEYFNPASERRNHVVEVNACFIGFDWSKMKNLNQFNQRNLISEFENAYMSRIEQIVNLLHDKLLNSQIHHFRFHFFFLPFKDVQDLRNHFLNRLGVNINA